MRASAGTPAPPFDVAPGQALRASLAAFCVRRGIGPWAGTGTAVGGLLCAKAMAKVRAKPKGGGRDSTRSQSRPIGVECRSEAGPRTGGEGRAYPHAQDDALRRPS
jgi:hypothetical protein